MPWQTPTLADVRRRNRDYITSRIRAPLVPNSVTRVVSDAAGGLAHLTLQYVDWLALQLLPDSAETEWLDKWANIFLVNADGTLGRKDPTVASGSVTITGTFGTVVPIGTVIQVSVNTVQVLYQTTADIIIGDTATPVTVTAVTPGAIGNRQLGDALNFITPTPGIAGPATVVSMTGGTDQETDDELRVRVLDRIRMPPMGGDADDYVEWALSYPGVTRAWCSPKEMGLGTVTIRFMMDDLRATSGGFPNPQDVANLQGFINSVRPVTAIDTFVVAPIPQAVSFTLHNLMNDDAGTRAAITASVQDMFMERAAPAYSKDGITQPATTIYSAWINEAVLRSPGVVSYDLEMSDAIPAGPGNICVLGNIILM